MVTVVSPVTATPIATPPGRAGCTGSPRLLFSNWNVFTVANGGAAPSFDTGGQRLCLVQINTYHWNNGNGAPPGTQGRDSPGGTRIGPYVAFGMADQGGVQNADWTANVPAGGPVILQGTYTVVDSEPATWSQNSVSGGFGFASVYVNDPIPTPTATPTVTRAGTPTSTATATRTQTAAPSPTPFPRPAVGAQVTPSAGALQTTITARDANCSPNNQLQSIQFRRLANATVDVGMPIITTVTTTPRTVDLPARPQSIQLTVLRPNSSLPVTVEMTVTDGRGTWPTFVGGGPSSFQASGSDSRAGGLVGARPVVHRPDRPEPQAASRGLREACSQCVAMALLLDPEDESILRCRPGTPPWRLQGSDEVDFAGVLPGY